MHEIRIARRTFLAATAAGAASLLLPRRARADHHEGALAAAMAASPLVYVSPLKKDGSESTCHGEMWFAADGKDVLVVTSNKGWRARSLGAGLDRARLWVGDFGVWRNAGEKWKDAPTFDAKAKLERDAAVQASALALFGKRYPAEWDKWGPRFKHGLEDGSRVLIRYSPA
jgi:hypothetical protein